MPSVLPPGNTDNPTAQLRLVVSHIKQAWPFFNRTGGADHFVWLPGDFGACEISEQVGTTAALLAGLGSWGVDVWDGMACKVWGFNLAALPGCLPTWLPSL
jgi:hypothetical protein